MARDRHQPWPGMALLATVATTALGVAACARASDEARRGAAARPARIITVGGAVTETVFALGAGDRVVAVDTSSVYPPEATGRAAVGYQRTLAAEGLLALDPDLLLASAEAGPASTLAALRDAGVTVVQLPEVDSIGEAADRIRAIGGAIGEPAAGDALATATAAAATRARDRVTPGDRRVLFVYGRGGGTTMVGGTDTAAAAMLALAGARPAVTAWSGFRPISGEAVIAAAPDAILVPSRGLDAMGGVAGVLALPGVATTPAGAARRVVAQDDLLLLGFGPRLPQAIDGLAAALAAP